MANELSGKSQESLIAEGKNFIVSESGELREAEAVAGCVISFVDCNTRRTQVVSLRPGDTFNYGDWNGSQCIRKSYTCR